MGIIIKQSIKGSVWSYIGVIIGFVTTSYFYPKFLTTDIVGLFGLLIAYSTLLGQFALLGLPGVTARMFPHFRDKKSGHHGFSFISFVFIIFGFSLFLLAYYFLAPYLVETNKEKSSLFVEYIYLLIPLTFFAMIFHQFDTYNKVLYDAVFGTFLSEFLQRFLIFLCISLFAFNMISVSQLIILYAIAISVKGLIILIFLAFKNEIHLKSEFHFITKELRKEIIDVALFSILTGLGSMIVFNIDKIIINQMLDLSNTGVYTIAFYFGTLVVIPSRPLLKISGTLIADAWKDNDLKKINNIYYKSCINQFIIGGFLFLGIWANIDNILTILGPDYQQSKWVIFFIGIGYLFDMLTGTNGQIISFSKYYRINLLFLGILIITAILAMFLLIPALGIVGAAIAIAASLFLNNIMRYIFILRKYHLQPFNLKFLIVGGYFILLYILLQLIPQQKLMLDIFIRGTVITLLSGAFFFLMPISEDIQGIGRNILTFLKRN